jgi:dihydropteroate synthase type 2
MPPRPRIVGVVNLTEDSFSDGGLYLKPARAVEQARRLLDAGADVVDLGPASSRPGARPVAPAEEIRRLEPVVDALLPLGVAVSVDSFQAETQRWALARGVAYLNDIHGFPDPDLHPALARSPAHLVVMHAVQERGPATRTRTDPGTIFERIADFLARRLAALEAAGVARDRLIVDPGMGHFLGQDPEPSLVALRRLPELRRRFDLPVWVSVSRKSFLGTLTGRGVHERGAATLAAELYACHQGADYVRTHDVRALVDALRIVEALDR